jgi:leader peptidase (prepilin peptidase)/N-methyltransferase
MEISLYLLVGVLGLIFGSFLNVVIYRLPRNLDLVLERSVCTSCGRQLKWYHNVPVISYLVLLGRCGFCKARISFRYPLVEILTGLFFLFFFWKYGFEIQFFVFSFLTLCLIPIFFIDLEHQIIPDWITLPGIVIGLGVSLLPKGIGIIPSGIGLLVGGGALYLTAVIGDKLFKKESMGGGDIKMAAMLGAFLGWQKVLLIFISSAFIGLIVSIIWMFLSEQVRKERVIPFGPFLAMGAMLAVIYGDQMISYYIQTFLNVN